MLFDNHTVEADKGKINVQLPLDFILLFCKLFEKVTKNLGFHLTLKTNDLQKITFTTIATDINITINGSYLSVPKLIPNSETQVMFNEPNKIIYLITSDSWRIERKLSTNGNEFQLDIGSARHIKSPKHLIASFQTADRIATPNEYIDIAICDNVNYRKYFREIDGYRFPKDGALTNFTKNDFLDQFRDLK